MEKEKIKFQQYRPLLFDHIRKVRIFLKYSKINSCQTQTHVCMYKLLFQDKVQNMDMWRMRDKRKIGGIEGK